jgi:hypothetical protein
MHKKVFVDLKTPIVSGGGSELKQLRVMVDYEKGGMNYFSGNIYESGVKVYLTPCTLTNGIVTQTILGAQHVCGYKVMLKAINRKSQKQIDIMADKILPYAQQIADLYSDGRHQDVVKLINDIITK